MLFDTDVDQATPFGGLAQLARVAEKVIDAIERKDRYTAGHTRRVMYFASRIAREMGVRGDQLEKVRLGAALHDAGKLAVSDAILRKPGALDEQERAVMARHPRLGLSVLTRVTAQGGVAGQLIDEVFAGMSYHHERWDGRGYPDGRRGTEIPWIARIVAVADAFDAMTSHRPYRRGIAREVAVAELSRQRGSQFCPQVIDAFLQAFGTVPGHHEEHVLV